jgi:threonine dehydratase
MDTQLTLELIERAREVVSHAARRTWCEPSDALSDQLGQPVWLKLENLQVTGSFKVRGALFAISQLSGEQRRAGVVTCSAGNHGKALAWAGKRAGTSVRVYVPRSIDAAKLAGMRRLGAEVVISEFDGYDDTQDWAIESERDTGRTFISPYDDPVIMAGNGGTLAAEVLAEVPDAREFILPVGGGGLAAGFSLYARHHAPGARIVGCQHVLSPALKLSLERGEAVTHLPAVETLAGGVEGGLGARPFEVLRDGISDVALVSEEQIIDALRWMLANHQYLIEPTAAVTVAACLAGAVGRLSAPAVVVLSGRNVNFETVAKLLS